MIVVVISLLLVALALAWAFRSPAPAEESPTTHSVTARCAPPDPRLTRLDGGVDVARFGGDETVVAVPSGCLYVPPRRVLRRGCWVDVFGPDGERVTDQRVESVDAVDGWQISVTLEDGSRWSVGPRGRLIGRGPRAGWSVVGRREVN